VAAFFCDFLALCRRIFRFNYDAPLPVGCQAVIGITWFPLVYHHACSGQSLKNSVRLFVAQLQVLYHLARSGLTGQLHKPDYRDNVPPAQQMLPVTF
jgi:hypothetical protein